MIHILVKFPQRHPTVVNFHTHNLVKASFHLVQCYAALRVRAGVDVVLSWHAAMYT